MKIKLFFEGESAIKKSGIGKALEHQLKALALNDVEVTHNHSDNEYDILHVNTYWLESYYEVQKARFKHKPVVIHAHSTIEDFQNSFMFSSLVAPVYNKWLLNFYSMADVLITPTPYSKSLIENYGLNKKIYAISNGIDLDDYKPDKNKEKEFREYFHLQEDEKVIISVGWFFERKGFDTFANVAKMMPEYKFIWFGDIAQSMPTKMIRDAIDSKPDNLILPGYISGNIIRGAFSGADLFFFPSREETEGIVVLEALASKTAVLVRDIDAFNPWLKDEINCRKGKTEEEFVEKIKLMLSSDNSSLIEEGYKVVEERSLKSIGKQLIDVYKTLL